MQNMIMADCKTKEIPKADTEKDQLLIIRRPIMFDIIAKK